MGDEARIRPDRDSVFGFNFRPDRMREITRALAEPAFAELDRGGAQPVARYATMTEYEEDWTYPVAFPPERPQVTLAGVLADRGLAQLHVAETEKYAHVTYFFNGGEEDPHAGETRELVPSPRDVPTYDHKPEMSAAGVAEAFVRHWREEAPSFAVVNFANPDMVGHTGVIPAAVQGVETVDGSLADVVAAVHADRRCVRDHRRPRQLRPHARAGRQPQHRALAQPRPADRHGRRARASATAACSPTWRRRCSQLLGIEQPAAMTGTRSLVVSR